MLNTVLFLTIAVFTIHLLKKVKRYEFKRNSLRLGYCIFVYFPILLNYYSIFMDGSLYFDFLEPFVPNFSENYVIRYLGIIVCIYSSFLIPKHPEE